MTGRIRIGLIVAFMGILALASATYFKCWPQGMVIYGVLGGSSGIWFIRSGVTSVHHTVNTH